MGIKSISLAAIAVVLSTSTNAALIDNGTYTTDDVTGLNWLDLSSTFGMSYIDAESANTGWRYATNAEVENLFLTAFDGFYETAFGNGISISTEGAYADQDSDVFAFFDLFDVYVAGNGDGASSGFYTDENNTLRTVGAIYRDLDGSTNVYGVDYGVEWPSTETRSWFGTFLVTEEVVSTVPVPAAVWLFGSGLLGLVGVARRKKT